MPLSRWSYDISRGDTSGVRVLRCWQGREDHDEPAKKEIANILPEHDHKRVSVWLMLSCSNRINAFKICIRWLHSFLMNNRREITANDLTELLVDNDITGFDPVYEAFKAYDPENEGFISENKLREIFMAFGLGEVSSTELDILTRVHIRPYIWKKTD